MMRRKLHGWLWGFLGLVALVPSCPSSDDGRVYTTSPDGRRFRIVPYCLPIRPLGPGGSPSCPGTLDEARTAAQNALDAGFSDDYFSGRPEVHACREPIVAYLPGGRSLGWGTSCFYDANSGQLLSIISGSDTPTECSDSPEPDTAAFVAIVVGQYLTCSSP